MGIPDEVVVQDHSAQFYAVRYSGYGRRYHKRLVRELLQDAYGEVLDVGCGTGFAHLIRPDLKMEGIDLSPEMLRQNPNPKARLGDVAAMPYRGGTFDFVLCRSLLHHLPDHHAGLMEMARVLKPGGRIAFLETNQSFLASWIRRWTQHGDRFSTYHHSFSDQVLRRAIQCYFTIDTFRYEGYFQYPLFGFPDILPIARWLPWTEGWYRSTGQVDRWLSQWPWINRLSWAVVIHARKPCLPDLLG